MGPLTKQAAEYKTYGRRAGRPLGIPYDPARCVFEIWSGDQCPRRNGKGPDRLYCGIHAKRYREGGRMIEQHKSIAVYSTMAAIVTALLLWIAVSTMDYDDAQRAEIEYCQHVRDGLWPDYKGIYDKVCEEEL